MPEFAEDTHGARHQLLVRREHARSVVVVVFQPDSDVPTEKDGLSCRGQLCRADRADAEDGLWRQQADHRLENVCAVGHRALKAAIAAEHDVDEVRRLVVALLDQPRDILQDVLGAEYFPFRLHAFFLEERRHLGLRIEALEAFLVSDFPIAVRQLTNHVAVDAAARRVVDDDVASGTN